MWQSGMDGLPFTFTVYRPAQLTELLLFKKRESRAIVFVFGRRKCKCNEYASGENNTSDRFENRGTNRPSIAPRTERQRSVL